ncbi:MAG TPA: hypothetical protein VK625_20635, partial [Flavitalea sp.]|nr:hypothetical protein [Flavitalea sp.]
GFGADSVKGSTARNKMSDWNTDQIWLRKSFQYNRTSHGNLMLRLNHSGPTQVYLNGSLIYDSTGSKYMAWNLNSKATGLLKQGNNVIAVYSKAGRRPFVDVSLFAMQDQTGDDIMYSPGQPNIVKGPNGFEWWLIYMGDKTNTRRSQYIDRVHFFDKTLYVDAITGSKTPGYHPPPSQPTFGDIFDNPGFNRNNYRLISGDLEVVSEEAIQQSNTVLKALINIPPATYYHFEAGVKPGAGSAGIYGWYRDEGNYLKILLNRQQKTLQLLTRQSCRNKIRNIKLPDDFNFGAYHTISILKNSSRFSLEVDGIKFSGASTFSESAFQGKGVPGLFSDRGNTAFDGIVFTKGFDEFDDNFAGWGQAHDGKTGGKWKVDANGISPGDKSGYSTIFKGDLLDKYEFGIQVSSKDTMGQAGIYPVYADSNNNIIATIDFKSHQLKVEVKSKGKSESPVIISLDKTSPYYSDIKYSDFFEKKFSFSSATLVSGLKLSRQPAFERDTLIDDIGNHLEIMYQYKDHWHPLTNIRESRSEHPGFDSLSFDPVYATGLKFVNKKADDRRRYVYKIWVKEECRLSYNLRVRKTANEILFFVDGENKLTLKNNFKASQIGLITDRNATSFNGALLYHIP